MLWPFRMASISGGMGKRDRHTNRKGGTIHKHDDRLLVVKDETEEEGLLDASEQDYYVQSTPWTILRTIGRFDFQYICVGLVQ